MFNIKLFVLLHCCRLADFVLPEALRVRGYDLGPDEEEELEAQFSDDEAVSTIVLLHAAWLLNIWL